MGGRIAGASIATGCVFIGALFGGAAVSIAWRAKGAGKNSLIKAVKTIMAGPPGPEKAALMRKIAAAQSAKAGAATGAAAAAAPKPTLGEAMEFLTQLPIVGPGYYVTLCLVGVAAMALFAVVRCDPKNNAVGALGSILAVVTGLVVANAGAVPVVGLRGFWGAVVIRIIELGLVASAATLVGGTLVMPSKASDALARSLATALSGVGTSVTGFGRLAEAARSAKERAAEDGPRLSGKKGGGPEVGTAGQTLEAKRGGATRARRRSAGPAGRSIFSLSDANVDRELLLRLRDDSTPPPVAADGSVIDGLSDDDVAGDGETSSEDDDGSGLVEGAESKRSLSRPLPGPAPASCRRGDGSASFPAGHGLAEPVTWWRCHLSDARTLLAESRFEPPSLFSGPRAAGGFRPARWAAIIAKTDALIARAAALEELCASPGASEASALLRGLHGRDVGGPHREAIGASAAALASLARLLRDPGGALPLWEGRAPGLHGPEVWDALQQKLAGAARGLQARYWEALEGTRGGKGGGKDGSRNQAAESSADGARDSMASHGAVIAMRGYHQAAMLSGGLIEAIRDLESTVLSALGLEQKGSTKDEEEGGGGGGASDEKKKEAAAPKKKEPNPWVIWAVTIFAGLSGLMVWMRLFRVAKGLPAVVSGAVKSRSSGGSKSNNAMKNATPLRRLTSGDARSAGEEASDVAGIADIDTDAATPSLERSAVIFGLKYFVATSGTLVACVLLLWKFPAELFDWQISTAFVVMAICLQPRLEDTVPRAVLQACLVLLGGSLGYGVMLRSSLAANPLYVAALLLSTVFVFGHINALQAVKKPLFLMLSTFMASLLCQFPKAATTKYFCGRVVSTAAGSLLALAFSAFVFPARASHECMDSVADALEASAELVSRAWDDFSRAAKAAESKGSSIPPLRADLYLSELQKKVNAPLAHVTALTRVDVLPSFFDACLPRGTDLVTPMPPAVKPMAAAASAVARRVAALQLATARECWGARSAEERRKEAAGAHPNGALSGVAAAALVRAADTEMRATIDDARALIDAVSASLRTRGEDRGLLCYLLPGGGASLECKRVAIVERIRATELSRVAATRAIRNSLPDIVAAAQSGKLTAEEDLEFEAWAAALMSSLDSLLAAGRAAASRVAQRRASAASVFGLC